MNSPNCSCGEHTETAYHYFLECPKYNDKRADMMRSLQLNNLPSNIDSLLNGCDQFSVMENEKIFEIVGQYIKESKRFTSD